MTKKSHKIWPNWEQFCGWSIPAKASFIGVPLAVFIAILGWFFFSNKTVNQMGSTNVHIEKNNGTLNINFKSNEDDTIVKSDNKVIEEARVDSVYDLIPEEPNMPQRSNEFQSLMTKIEAALHGKNAKVQESAMIYNYDTESKTEVDILITFNVGGNEYKTAIECQDRSRPAGVPWIAELKSKRDGCRIDKIIAIHSIGFTRSAEIQAQKYGIETLTPKTVDVETLENTIRPFTNFVTQTFRCKFPDGIAFKMIGPTPSKAEKDSSILIFGEKTEIVLCEFVDQVELIVRDALSKQYDLRKTTFNELDGSEKQKEIEVQLKFPRGAKFKATSGEILEVNSAMGIAVAKIETIKIDSVDYLSLKKGIISTHANFEMMDKKGSITLTQQENDPNTMGLCVSWGGGQISGPQIVDERLLGNVEIYCKLLSAR